MADRTPFEQALAAHGWERPAAFLAAFTQAAGMVGEPITLTERQLRRWRQPNPPRPRPRAWRVLHAMFGTSPIELGFPGPAYCRSPAPGVAMERRGEEEAVKRRAFVAGLGAVAGGAALPIASAHAGPVGTPHVLELREGLRALFALDNAHGGCEVRSLAVRHLARVRRVLNTGTYPETIGRQLELLAGETAEVCAWLSFDSGDQNAARLYYGEALTAATVLNDDGLRAHVLSMLSMQALYLNRPRDGLELASAARRRAEPMGSPVVLSIIAAREARALAKMSDHSAARVHLSRAMKLMERPHVGRPAPEWTAFHGPSELYFAQASLYGEAGQHRRAVPFLRAALTHRDQVYGRNRALDRLTLARGLLQAGDVDEGAAEAVGSLEHLTEVSSGRVMARLVEVRDLLACTDTRVAREALDILRGHPSMTGRDANDRV